MLAAERQDMQPRLRGTWEYVAFIRKSFEGPSILNQPMVAQL